MVYCKGILGFYAHLVKNLKITLKVGILFMGKFSKMFKKVGGWNVLKQYSKAHVLGYALTATAVNGLSKKSLEIVRLGVTNKIICKLRKKYRKFIADFTENYQQEEQTRSNKVWVCWFQGMDAAPELVQRCYRSLQENLKDREIIVLTDDNYRDYVQFPDHVQKKIDNGTITRTHMSDLLRLELLLRHGGTWIDSTVFCSGSNVPDYMLNSDLFLFRTLKPGADGQASIMSSWFMTACTNHPILHLTRALLYKYWEKHNGLVDYFLLHDFFEIATEYYPEAWNKVIPFSSATPHILLLRLFEEYDETIWNATRSMTPFHKLSYKFDKEQFELPNTYYQVLLK